MLTEITTNPRYRLEPTSQQVFSDGVKLFQSRLDKEWSLTDCTSFIVMQQLGISEALAYDHHFAQAGFTPLLRGLSMG